MWINTMLYNINNDKDNIKFICSGLNKEVIVYDIDSKKSAVVTPDEIYEIYKFMPISYDDNFSTAEHYSNIGKAIAYARLKEIEVPDVKKGAEFKRLKIGDKYWRVSIVPPNGADATTETERGYGANRGHYNSNNYFHTQERAKEVANKINFLLKLERLHDIFCPNYVPDFENVDAKYMVSLDCKKRYIVSSCYGDETQSTVYFPTKEIAYNVCDILNEELNKNECERE